MKSPLRLRYRMSAKWKTGSGDQKPPLSIVVFSFTHHSPHRRPGAARLVNDSMERFREEFDPYALKNITVAVPLWDSEGIPASVQKKVPFYPEDAKKKIVRGLWLTAKDSGE